MILREKPGKPTVHAVSKIVDFLGCRKLRRSFRMQVSSRTGNYTQKAIIGKAMEPLQSGSGTVNVIVN